MVIADVSFWRKRPALMVHDVASGRDRRVLEAHPSVYPQNCIVRTPAKAMVFFGGLAALKPGVDGVAIDDAGAGSTTPRWPTCLLYTSRCV